MGREGDKKLLSQQERAITGNASRMAKTLKSSPLQKSTENIGKFNFSRNLEINKRHETMQGAFTQENHQILVRKQASCPPHMFYSHLLHNERLTVTNNKIGQSEYTEYKLRECGLHLSLSNSYCTNVKPFPP